jgi:hypothetical protein
VVWERLGAGKGIYSSDSQSILLSVCRNFGINAEAAIMVSIHINHAEGAENRIGDSSTGDGIHASYPVFRI